LLTLYEITGESLWLRNAQLFSGEMIGQFWEEENADFYIAAGDQETLVARPRDYYDHAIPAGSSTAVLSLMRLSQLTGDEQWSRVAEKFLGKMASSLTRAPSAFGYLLGAMDFWLGPLYELVVSAPASVAGLTTLQRVIWRQYLPNKVVRPAALDNSRRAPADVRKLEGTADNPCPPSVSVCYNKQCQPPITDPVELEKILSPPKSSQKGTLSQ
jgi:uncharacterized protein YyaL (SSP411 family)